MLNNFLNLFTLPNLLTLLNYAVIFGILVFFHELGHFAAAKFFKMWVHEFAMGMFRPKFRLFHDGQTEYTFRAIPLGGFVRIAGMHIDDESSEIPEEVLHEDANAPIEARFNSRPIYQRYLVILAGPLASLLLGYIAFVALITISGVQTGKTTTEISAVMPGEPADKAGIQVGERIISLESVPVQDGTVLVEKIHNAPNQPLRFELSDAKGATRTVTVTPKSKEIDGKAIGLVGIGMVEERRMVSFPEALKYGVRNVGVWFEMIGSIIKKKQAKEALGGPLAILGAVKQVQSQGIEAQISLVGQLSLSLALFNLLPIPVLDGGHLTLLTLEAIRKRRLTSRQNGYVMTTGLAVLGVFFIYVMYNDIVRFFTKG
jgi:regulator of sigma E protease